MDQDPILFQYPLTVTGLRTNLWYLVCAEITAFRLSIRCTCDEMTKKLKNETGLLREALRVVMDDAVKRGIVEFESTDSHNLKIEYAYRLLVHDKKIIPLPQNQISLPNMKHRLAKWISNQLPADHALLS